MPEEFVAVGSLNDLKEKGVRVIHAGGRPIAVFCQDGQVSAVDNRCPHLGFPLHRGTVKDGILTCHWHEARFDLCGGCTFDTWADDVPTFDTQVRDGIVYVATAPRKREDRAYHLARLRKGMIENVSLIQAKSIIGLLKGGVDWRDIVRVVASLAAERRDMWGSGLTALTIVGRLMPFLSDETAYLALCYATRTVAGELQNAAPRRQRTELDGAHDASQLQRWMRHWIRSRHRDGAEFVLLTAIANGASPAELTELLFSAETDRVYSSQGHTLDGANKAFELLEMIGKEFAGAVLPLPVPALAAARGAEEDAHWHHPIEIIAPLRQAESALEESIREGRDKRWSDDGTLVTTLLGDDPIRIISALEAALRNGARPGELSTRVCYAAAMRLARFATSNDVGDWFNPQHTFIYANAVHQMLERAATPLTVRALFHAALSVYTDRFLNVPPARLPGERDSLDDLPADPDQLRKELLNTFDQRAQVDRAARIVARYVSLGHPIEPLIDTLTYATVREDLDFHALQVLEAGVQQYQQWQPSVEGQHILVGVARQLAAVAPTRRANLQMATVALRLHRGEHIYDETD